MSRRESVFAVRAARGPETAMTALELPCWPPELLWRRWGKS
jgi:hypothetical protein